MAKYITKMFDRLDRICYIYYGSTDNKIVEYVLKKNPGLASHPILLPMGMEIELPDSPPVPDSPRKFDTIRLWE